MAPLYRSSLPTNQLPSTCGTRETLEAGGGRNKNIFVNGFDSARETILRSGMTAILDFIRLHVVRNSLLDSMTLMKLVIG
jgi:hypothetical protein